VKDPYIDSSLSLPLPQRPCCLFSMVTVKDLRGPRGTQRREGPVDLARSSGSTGEAVCLSLKQWCTQSHMQKAFYCNKNEQLGPGEGLALPVLV
jgi:hypothetical protein